MWFAWTERKNNMNNKGTNDYGKVRWDGETLDRKQFASTLQEYIGIEWLEKEHKRSDWWRT